MLWLSAFIRSCPDTTARQWRKIDFHVTSATERVCGKALARWKLIGDMMIISILMNVRNCNFVRM
jgi:hypothetical protein